MTPEELVASTEAKPRFPRVVVAGALIIVATSLVLLVNKDQQPQSFDPKLVREQIKQTVIKSGTQVSGSVVSVDTTGGKTTISLNTKLVDLASVDTTSTIPPTVLDKTVVITVTPATVFDAVAQSDIKAGSIIAATLAASIYENSDPVATKIELFDTKTQVTKEVTHLSQIAGTVKKIEGTTLTIEAEVADQKKLATLDMSGSFTVPYVNKTYTITLTPTTAYFEKQSLKNIVINASVLVWGDENLYAADSFAATKLYVQP